LARRPKPAIAERRERKLRVRLRYRVAMTRPEPWLTTERLHLRRFTVDDFEHLCALYAEPSVARFVGGLKNRAEVGLILQSRVLEYYAERPGLGIWLTEERSTGAAVGLHLLNNIQGETFIQIGYMLLPAYWGCGYATEMAQALLRYGFETLELPQIVAITNLDNLPSQRVLARIGLERRGERAFSHPAYADQGALAWFEAEREAWLVSRQRVQ
jgi:RimJ/RimL family protein N-acetyltransferase